MIAGPVFAGAVQLTVNPPAVTLDIVGADGADGASPPHIRHRHRDRLGGRQHAGLVPLVALTSTRYSLFPAAFAGVVLTASAGAS